MEGFAMTQHQDIPIISERFIEAVAALGAVNSLATIRWYRTRLKTFLSWMKANQSIAFDDAAFNAFVLHLKQRVADETLSRDSLPGFYRVLRRFGKWLQAEGYLSKDPARALKTPRPKNHRTPKALSDNEVEKMLAASEGMPREAAMVRCLHCSGARVDELLQLR
jgi:site-specific recombinase XerD